MTFHEAVEMLRAAAKAAEGCEFDGGSGGERAACAIIGAADDLLATIPIPPAEDARAFVGWAVNGYVDGGGCIGCDRCVPVVRGVVACNLTGVTDGAAGVVDLRGPGCPWYEEAGER